MVSEVNSDPWLRANRTKVSTGNRAGAMDQKKGTLIEQR
jgi:hypothetical protein